MGIFTRFKDIVASNMSSMLDKAEDPEKLIKLMIREMEDTLIEIKSSCANAIANQKKVQRLLDDIQEKENFWANKAELAVAKGKDADLISFSLPDTCSEEDIATAVILHTKQVDKTYIQGKHIELS